ncbi:MAG: hypothetical protein ACI8XX_002571, partial [Polaribacter sp.]
MQVAKVLYLQHSPSLIWLIAFLLSLSPQVS